MVDSVRGLCLLLLFCFVVEFCGANPTLELEGANDDDVYDIDSLYDFLAARGRRSKDDDLFWANRGKRGNDHERTIRDAMSNHPKPNGFMFLMGKRAHDQEMKKNNLKPNGFHFLLSGKRSSMPRPNSFLFPVKRDAQSFNIPRPNGFMFPQALGKRASGQSNEEFFNTPRPISFFWPSMQGKRGSAVDHRSAATWMQNMARPTGFMFSMAKGKKSSEDIDDLFVDDDVADDADVVEEDGDDVMGALEPRQHRSVGAEPKDVATFFAGRGKKAGDEAHASGARALNSFVNGRGKKGNNDFDMFVAGRGK